ncbi:TIM44-like domain-containing protein [Bremerella cremea]|uniref:TIM44-like domain-containing protein n=1 Tax=Bremerella cremea TaxID=1031537 RepID=UPI0031E9E2A1
MYELLPVQSIPLAVGGEIAGFVVVIVMIVGGILTEHLHGGFRTLSLIRLGNKRARMDQMDQALEAIQEADPNFDLQTFCAAAGKAFIELEKAVDSRDLNDIRAFMSDGIYQRVVFRLEEEESLGRYRKTDKLELTEIVPVEISSAKNNENAFEVISLRIIGKAHREYQMMHAEASIALDEIEPISEVWTFLRRRGAKTRSGDFGSIHGNCPNCGADVSVNQWEKCPACDSMVRSGEHDWVLSEISDGSSWKVTKPFKMSSVTRYWIKQDKGFSSHYLEDRASVIFFRKFLADRIGTIDPLGKVATDRFCEAYAQKLQPDANGTRMIFLQPKILAADVSGVIAEAPLDKALMHVRWTALRGTVDRRGDFQLERDPVQFSSMMVLVRQHGTMTRIERTITSSHCPKCGAPESNNASHACEFCHTVLNDGALEWTLADILPFTSTAALALRKKAYEGIEPKVAVMTSEYDEDTQLKRVIVVDQAMPAFTKSEMEGIQIDGATPDIHVREDDVTLCRLIGVISTELNVSRKSAQGFILEVARACEVPRDVLIQGMKSRMPLDRAHLRDLNPMLVKRWLSAMVDVCLIDGRLEEWERKLLNATAMAIGLSQYDVDAVMRARTLQLKEWTEGMRSVDMFAWVVVVAASDGKFDPREVDQLKSLAAEFKITNQQLKEMCLAAKRNELEAPKPGDFGIGKYWLVRMIDMALADGNICANEQRVLTKVGASIGMTSFDMKQMIRRRRSILHQQAQQALRQNQASADDSLHVERDW